MTNVTTILWSLGVFLFILILVRIIFLREKKKENNYIYIGKSMTIGSREIQGDAYTTIESPSGLFSVLADGRGDSIGGRIASRLAVNTFAEIYGEYNSTMHPHYFYKKAFNAANKAILNLLENEQRGAASVGAILIKQNKLFYAVVGNVKIAVYRDGDLVPITEGHTLNVLAEKSFRQGNITRHDALKLLNNHRLYNYVGQEGFKEVELFDTPVTLYKNDIVMLMSDGVYEQLPWRKLEDILATKKDCQLKAFDIIETINRQISDDKDNASVILIQI